MTTRRNFLKTGSLFTAAGLITGCNNTSPAQKSEKAAFSYCLNTSTIGGQEPGLIKSIEIAAEAGYDGVELWVRDVKSYLEQGNSAPDLKKFIADKGLRVENAIGFAPWLAQGEVAKVQGFQQMEEEMQLMESIGCLRIAAAPAGVSANDPFDLFIAGKRYHDIIELGKSIGIMPQLEFWGASPVLYHFSQIMMIAAAANHPDVHLLPDVYHLFRGGSGFEGLKMLAGNVIEIFHMNDFVDTIPREKQQDKDRVYPGDGVAPLNEILTDLYNSGGTKILSVELFNETYWKEDPLIVAKTAIEKMKSLVSEVVPGS
ncbi:MAG: sugar phosphate isomerase/epimerase family protein [Bacteroidales bacterium]